MAGTVSFLMSTEVWGALVTHRITHDSHGMALSEQRVSSRVPQFFAIGALLHHACVHACMHRAAPGHHSKGPFTAKGFAHVEHRAGLLGCVRASSWRLRISQAASQAQWLKAHAHRQPPVMAWPARGSETRLLAAADPDRPHHLRLAPARTDTWG